MSSVEDAPHSDDLVQRLLVDVLAAIRGMLKGHCWLSVKTWLVFSSVVLKNILIQSGPSEPKEKLKSLSTIFPSPCHESFFLVYSLQEFEPRPNDRVKQDFFMFCSKVCYYVFLWKASHNANYVLGIWKFFFNRRLRSRAIVAYWSLFSNFHEQCLLLKIKWGSGEI